MRALLAAALLAAPAVAPAMAQTAAPAPGVFTTDEAAWCGAVFGRMVEAMRTAQGVPDTMRQEAELGLMIWEYELVASAPGRTEHIERVVLGQIDRLAEAMPQGESAEVANARGEFLVTRAQGCMERIEQTYQAAPHPIVQRLLARAEGQRGGQAESQAGAQAGTRGGAGAQTASPAAPKPKRNGLR